MDLIDVILWSAVFSCVAAIIYCGWLHEKLKTEIFKRDLEIESKKFQNQIDSIVIRSEIKKLQRMKK